MRLWSFWEFVTEGGRGVITEWYEKLPVEVQREFEDRLRYLANVPRHLWALPFYRQLTAQIGEIRFKANRVQHRPLGFFGPKAWQFTLLFPAREKDRKFIPKDALTQAEERRKLVLLNGRRVQEYDG
jgi:hypothetical protein